MDMGCLSFIQNQVATNTRQVNLTWADTIGFPHQKVIPNLRKEMAEIEARCKNTTFVSSDIDKPIPFTMFFKDDVKRCHAHKSQLQDR